MHVGTPNLVKHSPTSPTEVKIQYQIDPTNQNSWREIEAEMLAHIAWVKESGIEGQLVGPFDLGLDRNADYGVYPGTSMIREVWIFHTESDATLFRLRWLGSLPNLR